MQLVAGELFGDHAAQQHIVDTGIVVRQDDAQPLADLQRQCLGLQLLGMTFGHGEFAFQGDDLGAIRRTHHVPERRLARRGGDTDAGRAAIHIIGDIDAFGMTRQRLDAARPGLGEQGIAFQPLLRQQCLERTGAAPEAQRIDRQQRDVRIDRIALVAGQLEAPLHRLAQDHVQRIAGGHAVTRRHHELVAKGMLGAAIIVTQSAPLRPDQMGSDIERRVSQRPAEMAGLGIVAQHDQGHAGHEADIFQPAAFILVQCHRVRFVP